MAILIILLAILSEIEKEPWSVFLSISLSHLTTNPVQNNVLHGFLKSFLL